MYRITKEFHFSASHQLRGLPEVHPCSRMHGHNYIVKIELSSTKLNEVGFVEDYRDLDDIKIFIDRILDHQNLNEVFTFNPTAENLAKKIFHTFKITHPCLTAVEVSETPKTNARYSPEYDENPPV